MNQESVHQRLLKPDVLARLSNLELVARTVVEGVLIGLHRSPFFGFSQEFAEYRPYVEGDDPRFVDWNVYARSDRTYVKRYLGETNSHLMILLDASASMGYTTSQVDKLTYAKYLGASLAFLASRQHDAVGLMVFDDQVRQFLKPSTRTGTLQSVLHAIDEAHPARGTHMDRPFQKFRQHVRRRGMVVVISDFYCDHQKMVNSVRPLGFQGQDVMLMQVLDPGELRPEVDQPTLLQDTETGDAVEVSPEFMRNVYPEKVRQHINGLKEAAATSGAEHLLLKTSEPLDGAIRNYLTFRRRRG